MCLPRLSASVLRVARMGIFHSRPFPAFASLLPCVCCGFLHCSLPSHVFFGDVGLSGSPLGKPGISDVNVDDRTSCHHPSVLCRHDRPMSTHAVAATDRDGRNSALGHTEMGKILVSDGLDDEKMRTRARSGDSTAVGGIFRDVDNGSARGSLRMVTVGSGTPGTPRGMEPSLAGSQEGDGAVEDQEGEEENAGEDGKRAENWRQTPSNIANWGIDHVGSDGTDSNSNSQPQDDQCEGAFVVCLCFDIRALSGSLTFNVCAV